MGLDMYLYGSKYYWRTETPTKEDGYELKTKEIAIGYWRKHPNLHGYIVNTFAEGVDECQDIDLSEEDILKTIEAIKEDKLPHTDGFFFGASDGSEKEESIKIFEDALKWMQEKEKDVSKSIVYKASW